VKKNTLSTQYQNEMAEVHQLLERARQCAALSKPWILPDDGHDADDEFQNNYQSVGSNGSTVFVGKLMDMVFPAGRPFFRLDLASQIRYAQDQDEQTTKARQQALFLRELAMMAVLETGSLRKPSRRSQRVSFRTKKYMALLQCVITGDVLEQMTDEYRLKVLRRDQWTCRRDSSGDVLHYILQEKIDVLGVKTDQLTNEEVREKVNLTDIEADAPIEDRMHDMTTRCRYQHETKKWLVEQEINGVVFNQSEEPVSPFFSTPYELVAPEHHGRGLIENNLGDLSGLDNLERNLLDLMAMAAKFHPVRDPSSEITATDLERPTGTVLTGRVQGGNPTDVGMLGMALPREYTILESGISRKQQQLGQSMLTEIEALPTGDRVTALQVARVAREVELATGGILSSVSDDQQMPLLARLEYQMERDKMLNPLPEGSYEVVSMTGVNVLRSGERMQNIMSLAQVVSQLPPAAQQKIDYGVLVDVFARHTYIHEPGLIKSDEKIAEEAAAAQQQALQARAAEAGVDALAGAAQQQIAQQDQQ